MSIKGRKEILEARLMLYLKAEKAILAGQSYTVEGLSLTRADLGKVQEMISGLETEIIRLENQLAKKQIRTRIRYVIPR